MKKIFIVKNVKFKSKFGIQKRQIQFETLTSYLNRGGKINSKKLTLATPRNQAIPQQILSQAA